jgi:phage-related protein
MQVHIFAWAEEHLRTASNAEQAIIRKHIGKLRSGNVNEVHTKQLKGAIRELIVGSHRLTYFSIGEHLYLIRGFRKKSQKTPKKEILQTERVYKMVMRQHTI